MIPERLLSSQQPHLISLLCQPCQSPTIYRPSMCAREHKENSAVRSNNENRVRAHTHRQREAPREKLAEQIEFRLGRPQPANARRFAVLRVYMYTTHTPGKYDIHGNRGGDPFIHYPPGYFASPPGLFPPLGRGQGRGVCGGVAFYGRLRSTQASAARIIEGIGYHRRDYSFYFAREQECCF